MTTTSLLAPLSVGHKIGVRVNTNCKPSSTCQLDASTFVCGIRWLASFYGPAQVELRGEEVDERKLQHVSGVS